MNTKPSLVNMIVIAKQVEQFYLSNDDRRTIIVSFNQPINENIPIIVVRKDSFQETLNYVLANIFLFISMCTKVTYNNYGSIKTRIGLGSNHRNNLVQEIVNFKYNTYLTTNSSIGKFNFYN